MQSNKQITDTSKTTVKQAILDNQDNVNALRSSNSGTSFPSDPIAGMHCYREDEKQEYIYDGTDWFPVRGTEYYVDDDGLLHQIIYT